MTIERVLILGIGNTLLSDEGIGIHLVTAMQQKIGDIPGVTYMDGGTLSFTLAEPIADADGLIVVDAARMNQPPGSLQVFHNDAMDRYLSGNRSSVHEVSLGDLLDIARLSETLPAERCLVGIEPKELDWGESLSDAVAPTLDQGIEAIISILKEWRIFS
ncbi:MAG: HyaD/HybD family hydrogenase maturation endopeptidase [Candidatus Thiodiazotropha sp. (ex Ctena orbiculata)]|nr:HyaD/HybD family hydrogenase maturation endopeptidase [Candidatus Thiodiazotropha taylori]